jgi:hypothetical protein
MASGAATNHEISHLQTSVNNPGHSAYVDQPSYQQMDNDTIEEENLEQIERETYLN